AQVLLLDPELEAAAGQALELPGLRVVRLGHEYEALLESAATTPPDWPDSEGRPISVDYTSGTTGTPKGVVYTHRGAYLGAFAGLVETHLGPEGTYLWTLPMFHCNGWWFILGVGGRVCPLHGLWLRLGRGGRGCHGRRAAAARAGGGLARAARGRHASVRGAD